jgi:hypothetical protein
MGTKLRRSCDGTQFRYVFDATERGAAPRPSSMVGGRGGRSDSYFVK